MDEYHPNRALADFKRKGTASLRHGSILSRVGASCLPRSDYSDLADGIPRSLQGVRAQFPDREPFASWIISLNS